MSGRTIERGVLPDGTPYRIWERANGARYGFIEIRGRERRRSVGWIRKQLKGEKAKETSDVDR